MNLSQLNDQYDIPGQLKFIQGDNDFILIDIESDFAQATISTYGGQVLAFQPVNETEDLLFVSKLAYFESGKAIRGGIPVCWPWFGPAPSHADGPSHGLVRTRQWQVRQTALEPDGAITVILSINDSEETRKIWPHRFYLEIIINIRESLTMELKTHNTSVVSFSISQALHTYFNVEDSQNIQVTGLENTTYIDKIDGGKQKTQQGPVTISQEVDRIYTSEKTHLVLEDASLKRNIHIRSENSKTAVIWNPWKNKSVAMSDFDNNEYKTMVCVETANAGKDSITIPGNSIYSLVAEYQIEHKLSKAD
jgi:glucose-6-phosphate 1-epimerase